MMQLLVMIHDIDDGDDVDVDVGVDAGDSG